MAKSIKGFEAYRRGRKKRKRIKSSDGTVQQAWRTGQEAFRDWQTDAYRGQSGRREADVVPIN
jgi:hypothetical protein